jgi:hypothetical protein
MEEGVESGEMTTILYHIIDIVFLLKNRYREAEMMLRIIQTTYSLIDCQLLQFADYHLLTRLYAVCFDCCLSTSIIQNISASALFALTEIVFATAPPADSLALLAQLLEFLFAGKKFSWVKDQELKGMVWDLVIVAVRNYPTLKLEALARQERVMELLRTMWAASVDGAFTQGELEGSSSKVRKGENERSINFKKGGLPDFIRFYKCYVYFSIHLGLRAATEMVAFRASLAQFRLLYEL